MIIQPICPNINGLKQGDVLIADAGFTCLDDGDRCIVEVDPDRVGIDALYVQCRGAEDDSAAGKTERHYLVGQVDEGDEVIGFTRAPE